MKIKEEKKTDFLEALEVKVKFKDLSFPLKVAVVMSWFYVGVWIWLLVTILFGAFLNVFSV